MSGSAGLRILRKLGSFLAQMGMERPWRKFVLASLPKLGGRGRVIRYRKNAWSMD
jgi:hypothetical protein